MEVKKLNLYRRHIKSCLKGYQQNDRVYEPTTKQERAKDCQCPIAAEGVLYAGGPFITNRSTKTNDWATATEIAKTWVKWGATSEPVAEEVPQKTVIDAVADFLKSMGPQNKDLEESTRHGLQMLLEKRLIPFCIQSEIRYIKELDNYNTVNRFVESWYNFRPTRDRKGVPVPTTPVPLGTSTKKTEIERFRSFLAYCVDQEWIMQNFAKKIKFVHKVQKKYGMSSEEEQQFMDAALHYDNHIGVTRESAHEVYAFALVLRWTGLRISDAIVLHDTQLVPRASGEGWAISIHQQKTKELVYIPIPDEVQQALVRLPFKGTQGGKRFWFWTGVGDVKTVKNGWYKRIILVKEDVEKKGFKFLHKVSPHTFRHTFSISHLNAGTDIKFVSRWLGHKSITVTEKHYSHAIHETMVASDTAYDASLQRQQEATAKKFRTKMGLVAKSS
jgi:integrase